MEHYEKYTGRIDDVIRHNKTDHHKRFIASALAIIVAVTIVTVELTKNITEEVRTY